ncbi:hypothetical protein [Nostoc sp. MS1]|uniref:hypothetical protein n=1 Tax=Nostoc sp. MS1 TaxID=2764711 RepID=UPI001CC4C129|nr:hypothetical protein [Nostoc sp. MS1]
MPTVSVASPLGEVLMLRRAAPTEEASLRSLRDAYANAERVLDRRYLEPLRLLCVVN